MVIISAEYIKCEIDPVINRFSCDLRDLTLRCKGEYIDYCKIFIYLFKICDNYTYTCIRNTKIYRMSRDWI